MEVVSTLMTSDLHFFYLSGHHAYSDQQSDSLTCYWSKYLFLIIKSYQNERIKATGMTY